MIPLKSWEGKAKEFVASCHQQLLIDSKAIDLMKRSKFSEEQIAFALKQAETGTWVDEICRKLGSVQQRFTIGRSDIEGVMPSEVCRLRQLEEENRRLKQLVADLNLDKHMLQKALTKKL